MDDNTTQNIPEEKNDQENIIKTFGTRGMCKTPSAYHSNNDLYNHRCCKLDVYDWLKDIPLPEHQEEFDCVEVRFKNSKKDFFRNIDIPHLEVGDIVAVEASPGHDIGIVTLTGETVRLQMKKMDKSPESEEIKKIYRRARLNDIEKWVVSVESEHPTMIRTRKIAKELGLDMKVNDVEYQGDHTKAIFYYTADDRVDFRELIKRLAEEFRVRIEMRQIGVRQEAGRVGGIGSCGRELCCSTWMTGFQSVTTNTARTQQLSLNPQKLAGQCGKLKCCLNFEQDCYVDALKEFPPHELPLHTKEGRAFLQKTDIFKRIMWYSYENDPMNQMAIPLDKVLKIIELNKKNQKPEKLEDLAVIKEQKTEFENVIGQDDLTRFDEDDSDKKSRRRNKKGGNNPNGNRSRQRDNRPRPRNDRNAPRDERRSDSRQGNPRNSGRPGDNGDNRDNRNRRNGDHPNRRPQNRRNPNNRQQNNNSNRNRPQKNEGDDNKQSS